MPNGMMTISTWTSPQNIGASSFTFWIQINDVGMWDLVPEHWTFKSPDMETEEVMTLDSQWNEAPTGTYGSFGGWPLVVDQSNVGSVYPVRWDVEADGFNLTDPDIYWQYCAGVVRLGSVPDEHQGGF